MLYIEWLLNLLNGSPQHKVVGTKITHDTLVFTVDRENTFNTSRFSNLNKFLRWRRMWDVKERKKGKEVPWMFVVCILY